VDEEGENSPTFVCRDLKILNTKWFFAKM